MTLKKLFIEDYGEDGWKKLSPRLRGIFERIDAINVGKKPVSRRQIEKALS